MEEDDVELLIDIDAPLPDTSVQTTAPIELTAPTTFVISPPTLPHLPPSSHAPTSPQPPPLEPSAGSTAPLQPPLPAAAPTQPAAISTGSAAPSPFDAPVLTAPSSRFLDLLSPLRNRHSTESSSSTGDAASAVTSDATIHGPTDDSGFRTQLQDYKRRKSEQSSARAVLSSLKRGGEDFIDLTAFAAPLPRPTRLSSSSSSSAFSSTAPPRSAPWMTRSYQHPNFTLRLHEELLDFAAFISPTSSEEKQRAALIARVTELLERLFPSSTLASFGSYATKLYLPMSDLDLVVFDTPEMDLETGETALDVIGGELRKAGWASYLEVISNARIPIVKFTDKATGLKVDICRDQTSGLRAATYVSQMSVKFPAFRPLLLFLKYFLHVRRLNDTYTGGIGSYLLQLLLLSHLHFHPAQTHDVNLGLLLLSFLDLYGLQLNYETVGVSLSPPSYYLKEDKQRFNPQRPYLLSVENPLDVEHDVAVNSYCVLKVRRAFQYAFAQLTRRQVMEGDWDGSLLALLVRGEHEPLVEQRASKKRKERDSRQRSRGSRAEAVHHLDVDDEDGDREQSHASASVDEERMQDDEDKDEHERSRPHSSARSGRSTRDLEDARTAKERAKREKKERKEKRRAEKREKKRKAEAEVEGAMESSKKMKQEDERSVRMVRYQHSETVWQTMPASLGREWLRNQGFTKAEATDLWRWRMAKRAEEEAKADAEMMEPPAERELSNESPAAANVPLDAVDATTAAGASAVKEEKPEEKTQPGPPSGASLNSARINELMAWYGDKDAKWLRMPFLEARRWLQERGLSASLREKLATLHPQFHTVDDSEGAEQNGNAEGGEKQQTAAAVDAASRVDAARPAWLDLDRSRLEEFLRADIVNKPLQRAMRRAYKDDQEGWKLTNKQRKESDPADHRTEAKHEVAQPEEQKHAGPPQMAAMQSAEAKQAMEDVPPAATSEVPLPSKAEMELEALLMQQRELKLALNRTKKEMKRRKMEMELAVKEASTAASAASASSSGSQTVTSVVAVGSSPPAPAAPSGGRPLTQNQLRRRAFDQEVENAVKARLIARMIEEARAVGKTLDLNHLFITKRERKPLNAAIAAEKRRIRGERKAQHAQDRQSASVLQQQPHPPTVAAAREEKDQQLLQTANGVEGRVTVSLPATSTTQSALAVKQKKASKGMRKTVQVSPAAAEQPSALHKTTNA